MHHPWREFREEWPHVRLHVTALPGDLHAVTDGANVWLHDKLLQVERRVAIAHEIEHLRRGDRCTQDPAVERRIDVAVAQRLVAFEELAAALPWARSIEELADELWVTVDIAQARLDALWPREVAILAELVADLQT